MPAALPEGADIDLCLAFRRGQDALATILDRHKGLAFAYSRRLYNRHANPKRLGCDEHDLLQEAHHGIMDAIRGWNPKKGSFSNYCHIWMKKRCLAFLDRCQPLNAGEMGEIHAREPRIPNDYAKRLPDLKPLVDEGLISQEDYRIMQAICAPQNAQEEEMQRMFATWWQGRRKAVLARVAVAVRVYQEREGKRLRKRPRMLWDEAA